VPARQMRQPTNRPGAALHKPGAHNAERFAPGASRQAGLTPADAVKLKRDSAAGGGFERLEVGEWRNVVARAAKTRALARGIGTDTGCRGRAPTAALLPAHAFRP
jgi:hypothetical protein